MRHRKPSLHLRAEPPWLSPSGTLPTLDYLTGMTGAASALLCPVSFWVDKSPPGTSLALRQLVWMPGRLGSCIYTQAAVVPCKLERKATKEKNNLNISMNRLQEKPASASLCVAVSKHPSLCKLAFSLTVLLIAL